MSYILELVHTSAFKLGVQPLDTHRNKISRKNKKVKKKKNSGISSPSFSFLSERFSLCLIHSQKKYLSESFLSKRILELKCCLGSGIFTSAEERGIAPHTRKQRVLAAISKLRSAYFTGYKNKIARIARTIYIYTRKWFPLWGERDHSLKLFCMCDKRFEISKTKQNGGGNRTTDLTIYLHHLILAFIIRNQSIFVYIHKYIHALYIMNCSKK